LFALGLGSAAGEVDLTLKVYYDHVSTTNLIPGRLDGSAHL